MLSANHGTNGSYVSEMSLGFRRSYAGSIAIKSRASLGRTKLPYQLYHSSTNSRRVDDRVAIPECSSADVFLSTSQGRVHGLFCP